MRFRSAGTAPDPQAPTKQVPDPESPISPHRPTQDNLQEK